MPLLSRGRVLLSCSWINDLVKGRVNSLYGRVSHHARRGYKSADITFRTNFIYL